MVKTRKNISIDSKTHEKLRKLAFKRKTDIAKLIREATELLLHPLYTVNEEGFIEKI